MDKYISYIKNNIAGKSVSRLAILTSVATILGVSSIVMAAKSTLAATMIYSEDFTGQTNQGARGSNININPRRVDWRINVNNANLSNNQDWFRVVTRSGNQVFEGRDLNGNLPSNAFRQATWISPLIDIDGFTNVTFSLDASATNNHENSDFYDIRYIIDGGSPTKLIDVGGFGNANRSLRNDNFSPLTVTQGVPSGSTLRLRVTMRNNGANEIYRLDNVVVRGELVEVPEPSSAIGLLTLASLGGGSIFLRKKEKS